MRKKSGRWRTTQRARPPGGGLVVGDVRRLATIAASTWSRRARAASRFVSGEKRDGARARPASSAISPEVELVDRLVEVAARRRRHAVGAVAEEDLVQVERQDLALREARLQAPGEDRLADLALDGPLGGEERLRHLLRDRRAALRHLAGAQVGAQRAARCRGSRCPRARRSGGPRPRGTPAPAAAGTARTAGSRAARWPARPAGVPSQPRTTVVAAATLW